MCVAAKVQFKDKDIDAADWPALKANKDLYPTGGLPTIGVNGCRMGETMALTRFLAISTGWFPQDPKCAWAADTCMDMWTDCINAIGAFFYATDDTREAATKKIFDCIEAFVCVTAERKTQMGWKHAAGNKLSVGDVALFTIWINTAGNDICPLKEPICAIFKKYPCLKETIDCMCKLNKHHNDSRAPRMF